MEINAEFQEWCKREGHPYAVRSDGSYVGSTETRHGAYLAAAAKRDELLRECFAMLEGADGTIRVELNAHDPHLDTLLSRLRDAGYGTPGA